jgi:hypothetical protein
VGETLALVAVLEKRQSTAACEYLSCDLCYLQNIILQRSGDGRFISTTERARTDADATWATGN